MAGLGFWKEICMRFGIRLQIFLLFGFVAGPAWAQDPLPSWNEGPNKKSIIDFVTRVTKEGGPNFVPVAERIATFDNDGTLWCEHPMYVQLVYLVAQVKAKAGDHPEWRDKEPFKAILADDLSTALAGGEKKVMDAMMEVHSGMTVDEYEASVKAWLQTAQHPRFRRPYTDLVYQPMIELLTYVRANGFKTYVVSGGGIEFMRPWMVKAYGIPPEQIVGSSIKVKFELRDRKPILTRLPVLDFIDDGPGKPEGIQKFIGRRPVMSFGNSDGDLEMLQWTTGSPGPRFGLIVHHTDAEREYAYDRNTTVGRLDKALDLAPKNGWVVVDMKSDWKVIFPFQK
jgi:haloacid dehalogenase-like hydrolase